MTLSSTVAWATASEDVSGSAAKYYLATNNTAGTEFEFGSVVAPAPAAQNFELANISGINSLTAIAGTFGGQSGGGEILRTTNRGLSWTKVSTTSQFVAGQGGFLDFVHMFNATDGVAVGDPTNGYYEILRTTDGGLTWVRNSQATSPVPLPNSGEAALVNSFFTRGNTIWFTGATLGSQTPQRVFKSIDKGATWTASGLTPLLESMSKIAFKDDFNGIAFNTVSNGTQRTGVNYIKTTDGGNTWSTFTPVNTATGSFFLNDIDGVNGVYYSVGPRFPQATPQAPEDFGSSYSSDGINWTNMTVSAGRRTGYFFTLDLIPGTTPNTTVGYGGLLTDANGMGGVYKFSRTTTATRDAALQNALTVYPNPSNTGVFSVDLGSTLKGSAQLTVVDAMGRQVKSQTVNSTAVGSKAFTVDLSNEKAGVYTLQFRTDAGIATQKVVIN
ncbi:T9SS type A sorting domain-containing protein [Hymenobacter armeniacus]|uniref:T9SS type A sorting domain-containing protein n=1 Tax=Hymenobacter armeniacus TaxID=2771358 RepID=A0ABR8JP60_9BACT|nr:T9SS type A sorting domain-containing protein [Hymenobacter armeniacus]MBD2720845.1 T9SS type A sorting domain-containing protein [Hymenobacter armeniacus]